MVNEYIDKEVKMGSYSANYLSYILLKNNKTTILGNVVKNNEGDSASKEVLLREEGSDSVR